MLLTVQSDQLRRVLALRSASFVYTPSVNLSVDTFRNSMSRSTSPKVLLVIRSIVNM